MSIHSPHYDRHPEGRTLLLSSDICRDLHGTRRVGAPQWLTTLYDIYLHTHTLSKSFLKYLFWLAHALEAVGIIITLYVKKKNWSSGNKNTFLNSKLLKTIVEHGPNPLIIHWVLSAFPRIEITQLGVAETYTSPDLTVLVLCAMPGRRALARLTWPLCRWLHLVKPPVTQG